jgi:hypothetical protein
MVNQNGISDTAIAGTAMAAQALPDFSVCGQPFQYSAQWRLIGGRTGDRTGCGLPPVTWLRPPQPVPQASWQRCADVGPLGEHIEGSHVLGYR